MDRYDAMTDARTIASGSGAPAAIPGDAYFRCPVCKSNAYDAVRLQRQDGSLFHSGLYSCIGCTLTFTDPSRFSHPPDMTVQGA
jgi:hypothetical protein